MNVRADAPLHSLAILEGDLSWPLVLTSPAGVNLLLNGFVNDIAEGIDPETGMSVSGRRASAAVSLLRLPQLPTAEAESNRRPWLVTFNDALGVASVWKVAEVLPDRTLGVVKLLLEAYGAGAH